jgi:hypothetical protein
MEYFNYRDDSDYPEPPELTDEQLHRQYLAYLEEFEPYELPPFAPIAEEPVVPFVRRAA